MRSVTALLLSLAPCCTAWAPPCGVSRHGVALKALGETEAATSRQGALHELVTKFHHFEFYCGDALTSRLRFQAGLGMPHVAEISLGLSSPSCSSQVVRSGELTFVFTAPARPQLPGEPKGENLLPWFDGDSAREFTAAHGMGVYAIGVEVLDATLAFEAAVRDGAMAVTRPTKVEDEDGQCVVAEIKIYGDCILRMVQTHGDGISKPYTGVHLPGYVDMRPEKAPEATFGLERCDHCVGNVWDLKKAMKYVKGFTQFHEFAEFDHADVGTVNSGLNSVVLSSKNEKVLLPLNEPVFDTPVKSQIETYLEWHGGAGVQHLALFTSDIVRTVSQMRNVGLFAFMNRPDKGYYERTRSRLTSELYQMESSVLEDAMSRAMEAGVLIDADDEGILLQVFTKPVTDRPTLFLEVIQRIGCEGRAGCGGFGKGNFRELFRQIEELERDQKLHETSS